MMNQYNPTASLAWRANMDISPCTDLAAVQSYVAKYCSKEETQSASYRDIARSLAPYVSDTQPALSFATKIINRFIGERDWSAQEVSHILFGVPLHSGSRQVLHFDCRPENELAQIMEFDADGNEQLSGKPILEKYKERRADYESATLFEFLSTFEHAARSVHKPRSNARARAIVYQPQYSHLPTHQDYEQYCRLKIVLHHPWRLYPNLPWRGQYTWALAFLACQVRSFFPKGETLFRKILLTRLSRYSAGNMTSITSNHLRLPPKKMSLTLNSPRKIANTTLW